MIATDDDVVADEDWIEKLVAPFGQDDVMVVTGNVFPAELEAVAQRQFELYGGLSRGFDRFEFSGERMRQCRRAVPTWRIGSTANAAFRASIFSDPRIGLMDEALGAGMPTGCSEDTYLFYQVLRAGYRIVYEPGAYVWHRHRTTKAALPELFNYSKGHVAYHLTTLLRIATLGPLSGSSSTSHWRRHAYLPPAARVDRLSGPSRALRSHWECHWTLGAVAIAPTRASHGTKPSKSVERGERRVSSGGQDIRSIARRVKGGRPMFYTWKVRALKVPALNRLWRRWRESRGERPGSYSDIPGYVREYARGRSFADIGCMWGVNGEYALSRKRRARRA